MTLLIQRSKTQRRKPLLLERKLKKKDKEKHGQAAKGGSRNEPAKAKKHEFDRRPGPGAQRKPDKRTGGGKWDKEVQTAFEDEVYAAKEAKQDVVPPATTSEAPAITDTKDAKDAKDAKDKPAEKEPLSLEEFLEAQKAKRPENDELVPRAPRVDGDFRAVKELVKVDQKLYPNPVEKKEEKEEVKKPQKKEVKKNVKKGEKKETEAPRPKKVSQVRLTWGEFYTKVKPADRAPRAQREREEEPDSTPADDVQQTEEPVAQEQNAGDVEQKDAPTGETEGRGRGRGRGDFRGRGRGDFRGRGRGDFRGRGRGDGRGRGRGRGRGEGRGRGGGRGRGEGRGRGRGSRGGRGRGRDAPQGQSGFNTEADFPKLQA